MRLPFVGLIITLTASASANAALYTFTTLSVPGAQPSYYGTEALGINNTGQVVGTYTSIDNLQGFVFDQTTSTYTTFNDPVSTTGMIAQGINDSGQITGYIPFATADRLFLRDPTTGAFTSLASQAGQSNPSATGINNAGQIIGYYTSGSANLTSFLRDPVTGAYASLQNTNADAQSMPSFTLANGINNAGQIVGFFADTDGTNNGFIFDPTTGAYTTLSYPGAIDTMVQGINNSGQVVGYYDTNQGTTGFMLDLATGTYTTLSEPGAVSTYVTGINDLGQIVGSLYQRSRMFPPPSWPLQPPRRRRCPSPPAWRSSASASSASAWPGTGAPKPVKPRGHPGRVAESVDPVSPARYAP